MNDAPDRQRIDKWLWFARVVKTRALAQELAASGRVRLNGRKVDAAAQPVRLGDVLTVGLGQRVRIYRVTGFAGRRGSFPQAQTLYDDLSPAPEPTGEATEPPLPASPLPVRGEGRPTKRDRRRLAGPPSGG